MMNKNTIRITEADLKYIISETVRRVIKENIENTYIPLETEIGYDWDDYDLWADVLYNTQTKEIEIAQYGHGHGPSKTGSGNIQDAIANGICDEREVRMAIINHLGNRVIPNSNVVHYVLTECINMDLAIPCKVSRSRNIKGDCILYRVIKKRNDFRPYYGRSFDSKYDTYFCVYSQSTNTVAEVGVNTVTISEEVIENIKQETINVLMDMDLKSLIHLCAYKMSYASCDSRKLSSYAENACMKAIEKLYQSDGNIVPDNVNSPQQAKRDAKQQAFKEKKMPELISWARSVHPDWSEEEINALAEKVWNKRYA